MLFYASLFLFCVAFSAIALWIYRSMSDVGKAAYRAILPSSKDKYGDRGRERTVTLNHSLGSAATPWGWGSDRGPRRAVPVAKVAQSTAAAPWGWPGNKGTVERRSPGMTENISEAASTLKSAFDEAATRQAARPTVGWPYREEKFDFDGKEYKVTRKARVRKVSRGSAKPWGW